VEPEEQVPYKDFLERPMEAETVEQRKEMKVQAAAVVDTV
jgi:hypothetical protein